MRENGSELVLAHSTVEEAQGGVRAGSHAPLHPPMADDVHLRQDVGPDVTFHAQFPRPGRYKMWTVLLAGGDRLQADFVIEVLP